MEMGLLKSKGLLQPYEAPEAASYPAGTKDKGKFFTAIYARNFVMGYNTAMVAEKDRPKDWPDLLDPKWKGKFGSMKKSSNGTALWSTIGAGKRRESSLKRWPRSNRTLRRGHSLLAQLLAAGEFPVALVFPFEIEQLKRRGAPVEWSNSSDPIVTSINVVALSAKAPHPNAGKLLINYILSEEGQTIIKNVSRVPIRPSVKPNVARLDQSTLKIHYVPADMYQKIAAYEKEFRDLFWKK